MNKAFGILILGLFAIIIASDIALVLPHSSLLEVYDSVPDEVLFYYSAQQLAGHLRAGDWHAISAFGTPFGYGSPFWLTAAALIIALPSASVHGLAAHKLVFLLMKWAAFGGLAALVWRRRGVAAAACFSMLVASCSAFFFYGKVFSPEFETLALSAAAIACMWVDDFRVRWQAGAALFAALLATAIKATAAPVLLATGIYLLIGVWRAQDGRGVKVGRLIVAALLALPACGLPLMTAAGRADVAHWIALNIGRHFSVYCASAWVTCRAVTWDMIPLSGLIGYVGIPTVLVLLVVSVIRQKGKLDRTVMMGYAITMCGLAGLSSVVSADGYLDWYVWVPTMLILTGAAISIADPVFWRGVPVVVCMVALVASTPEAIRRAEVRIDVLQGLATASSARALSAKLIAAVHDECGRPAVIATDLLAALDTSQRPEISVLRMRDFMGVSGGIPTKPIVAEHGMLPTSVFVSGASQEIPDLSSITYVAVNRKLLSKNQGQFLALTRVTLSHDGQQAFLDGNSFHLLGTAGDLTIYQKAAAPIDCQRPTS